MTGEDLARAPGEQDAAIAVANDDRWQVAGGGMLTVYPIEERVPRTHRRAYLDAAANVLGYKPLVVA